MCPLLIGTFHTEAKRTEEPKHENDHGVENGEYAPLHILVQRASVPVQAEATAQNSEIQRWVVVMHIRDAGHGNEREVMQEPADDGVEAGIVDVVNLCPGEFVVTPLPADRVPEHHGPEEDKGESRSPVDEGVAQEEVFDDGVVPAAHAETDVQERPLPGFGGKVVLFVGIRNQSVVGGHHGDVQMNEIAEERGFVGARVAGWNCARVAN